MVGHSINARRAYDALALVRSLVEEHGTPDHRERLDRIAGSRVPPPSRAIEYQAYMAESLGIALELLGPLVEASKPRPRGRPRKQEAS